MTANFESWGTTGANDPADAPKVQTALDTAGLGSDLQLLPGFYKITSDSWEQTRLLSWELEYGATLRGDNEEDLEEPLDSERFDLLRINIARVPGVVEGARNLRVTGGTMLTHNLDNTPNRAQEGNYAAGGFAIAVNSAGNTIQAFNENCVPVIGLRIDSVNIAGGSGAILFYGPPGEEPENEEDPLIFVDSVMFSGAENCSIGNGVVLSRVSDGMRFVNNVCYGIKPAYTLDALDGAYNHIFEGGTANNQRGALQVLNGSFWKLHNMQIEHGIGNTEANPEWDEMDPGTVFTGSNPPSSDHQFRVAPNDQLPPSFGPSVSVLGSDYPSVGGQIKGCHLGAGGFVTHSIYLDNAVGTVIDENYFNIASGADLVLSGDSKDTVIGTRNQFRGARSKAAVGTVTDASRLMQIVLGDPFVPGARGMWQSGTALITGFQGGWGIEGLEIMVTETGMVTFNGGMSGGALTGTICTFREWLRPVSDARLIVVTAAGAVHGLNLSPAGVLSILGTLPDDDINFANATYSAVLNQPYV